MKTRTVCQFVLAITVLSQSADLSADEGQLWKEVALLSHSQPLGRSETIAKEFAAKRNTSVKKLIAILRNTRLSKSRRVAAARMLGVLRASEAVDDLLQQLTLMPDLSDECVFLCQVALIQIGKPASRKALLLLQKKNSPLRTMLLREIVKQVEGRDVAIFLVRAEINSIQNPEARARMNAVLKQLSKR